MLFILVITFQQQQYALPNCWHHPEEMYTWVYWYTSNCVADFWWCFVSINVEGFVSSLDKTIRTIRTTVHRSPHMITLCTRWRNLSSSPYYGITNRQSYIRKVLSRYLHSPGSHQSTRFLEWLNDSLTHTITLSMKKMNQFISKLIVFVRWLEICGWITSKFCILICFDRHCAFSCGSLEG